MHKSVQLRSLQFYILILPFITCAVVGLVLVAFLSQNPWFAIGYSAFVLLYFVVFEIPIHCRYCPCYNTEGDLLQCHAKPFFPKIWKPSLDIASIPEKIIFLTALVLILMAPLANHVYGLLLVYSSFRIPVYLLIGTTGILLIQVCTLITLLFFQINLFCKECTNQHCLLYALIQPKDFEKDEENSAPETQQEQATYTEVKKEND